MNLLFFDIQYTGHHIEYINHILNYLLLNNQPQNKYYFVVHPNFFNLNKNVVNLVSELNNVIFIEVSESHIDRINVSNKFKKSINNTKIVKYYVEKFKIDICYLMFFNNFQLGLSIVNLPCKIKGILFMQFTNMTINSFQSFYYYLRRFLPLVFALKNKNINSIFVLNDKQSILKLNSKFKKQNLFKYLVDPIPKIEPIHNFRLDEEYNISNDKTVFLHFGALSDRKGVLEIIESSYLINQNLQKKITILIAGKTSDTLLEKKIEQNIILANKNTDVQIIWDNNFVSNSKMASLFQSSDFILMPYKNPEASSGILGHAINAAKPVIGPSSGLIGRLIKYYKIGHSLKYINPICIADAINNYQSIEYDKSSLNVFIKEHTPEKFAETLISGN